MTLYQLHLSFGVEQYEWVIAFGETGRSAEEDILLQGVIPAVTSRTESNRYKQSGCLVFSPMFERRTSRIQVGF